MNEYWLILEPSAKKKKKKSAEEQALVLEDFTKMFKERFAAKPTGKVKNFERAS